MFPRHPHRLRGHNLRCTRLDLHDLGPNIKVDGLGNSKVITAIVDTDNKTLKLNDPCVILPPPLRTGFPEDSFKTTNTAGSRPSFNGAR